VAARLRQGSASEDQARAFKQVVFDRLREAEITATDIAHGSESPIQHSAQNAGGVRSHEVR
jgi:hypothetical protein